MTTVHGAASRCSCALATVAFALLPGTAESAGFQIVPQNGSGLGNAYAGAAATREEPGAMFFNPAALAWIHGRQVSLGVARFDASSSFSDEGSVAPGPGPFTRPLTGNGGDPGTTSYIPSGYFSMPLTRQVTIGLGLSSPFGLSTEYEPGWRGQFLALKSEIRSYDINPAVGVRISERLSIGAGVSRQRLDAALTQAVNAFVFGPPDSAFRVRGHSLAWGYNLGAQYQPMPRLTLGTAYRSSVRHEIKGNYAFDPGTPPPIVLGAGLPSATGPAKVDLKLPETYTFAAAWRANDRWELLADGTRTGWSSAKEQRVQFPNGAADQVTAFNWRSTWRVSVGANYRLNDQWTLRGGIAFDRSPVPDDTRSPRLPGEDNVTVAFGARVQLSSMFTLNAGYTYVHSRDAHVSYSAGNPVANGTLNGRYKSHLNIIGAHLTAAF
jgi:long-chain fatty acid transport protein